MVYGDPERKGGDVPRGRLSGRSSFTQPPVYVMALTELLARDFDVDPWVTREVESALSWLWENRLEGGLLRIVHPWESGADISPRFDDWYGKDLLKDLHRQYDILVETTEYDAVGVAASNTRFLVAPAAFNAIAADAALELSRLLDSRLWEQRGADLSAAIDAQLWDEDERLWRDRADLPPHDPSGSSSTPTLDGVLGALSTQSSSRASQALEQCVLGGRFAAPYGPRYLSADHPEYDPDTYWRGPTWPQLNYLLVAAARRHGLTEIAKELSRTSIRGTWSSGFSEYWNPENGEARGATPQSWAAVSVALLDLTHETTDRSFS